MSWEETVLIFVGSGLVLAALFVEIEHKIIWNNYKKHYHPHKNRFFDKLFRPNKLVYRLNVYVLWPLVIILGLIIVLKSAG